MEYFSSIIPSKISKYLTYRVPWPHLRWSIEIARDLRLRVKTCNYAKTSSRIRGPSSFWDGSGGPAVRPSSGSPHFCIVINEHSLGPDFGAIALYNIFIMNYATRSFSAAAFAVPQFRQFSSSSVSHSPFPDPFPWDITFVLSPQTRQGLISGLARESWNFCQHVATNYIKRHVHVVILFVTTRNWHEFAN